MEGEAENQWRGNKREEKGEREGEQWLMMMKAGGREGNRGSKVHTNYGSEFYLMRKKAKTDKLMMKKTVSYNPER